uniref:Small heat-shock protein n=1 Tax=Rhizophora mucronata TaxID=61149 RepID=A0A2P2KCM5_RHIMU
MTEFKLLLQFMGMRWVGDILSWQPAKWAANMSILLLITSPSISLFFAHTRLHS